MSANPCLKGGLEAYVPRPEKPWNDKRIHHLYNRLCNGAPPYLISLAKANTPTKLVGYLLDTAKKHPLPGEKVSNSSGTIDYSYAWKEDKDYNDPLIGNKFYQLVRMWFNGMMTEGVRHKLALFWSNHFVTGSSVYGYYPSWAFQYYYVLHKHALGNFKKFVYEMGRNPAMLIYLDGRLNTKNAPNENYARELLELFTMGPGNYTEKDIEEIAKALTGWTLYIYDANAGRSWIHPVEYYEPDSSVPGKVDEYKKIPFNANLHQYGGKTVFGKTFSTNRVNPDYGKADYDNVINLIFSERTNEVAKFICRKLYRFYMYNDAPEDIVDGLAEVFKQRWDILETLKVLFTSEHFYEEESMGAMIKSNIDTLVHIFRSIDLKMNEDFFPFDENRKSVPSNNLNRDALLALYNQSSTIGQTLLEPVNVAGWPGHRSWLSEFVMVNRWRYIRDHFDYYLPYQETKNKYRQFLKDISNDSSDPDYIVRKLLEYFITLPLSEDIILTAIGVFKARVPANYYIDGTWDLDYSMVPTQFMDVMKHISTLPEFQLL
ncbi:MAG: DUF1800 domain-containing protein [Saprospiraceae bacterium]|nr:DUF1800 domain-containing protein [Saprospiraceae bacterium]